MKVITSRSFPSSLQFLCCKRLRQFVPAHLSVLDALAMPPGLRGVLANNMTWMLSVPQTPDANAPSHESYICSICQPLKRVLQYCQDEREDESDEEAQMSHLALHLADSDDESSYQESTSSDVIDWPELMDTSLTNENEDQAPSLHAGCSGIKSTHTHRASPSPVKPSPKKKSRLENTVVEWKKREETKSESDNESTGEEVETKSPVLGKRKY